MEECNMDIRITENAAAELNNINADSLRIEIQGYGWSGPYFGLAQGEPQYGDVTIEKDGRTFAVEREIADAVNYLEIDYYKGWLRKGFLININGSRSSCWCGSTRGIGNKAPGVFLFHLFHTWKRQFKMGKKQQSQNYTGQPGQRRFFMMKPQQRKQNHVE